MNSLAGYGSSSDDDDEVMNTKKSAELAKKSAQMSSKVGTRQIPSAAAQATTSRVGTSEEPKGKKLELFSLVPKHIQDALLRGDTLQDSDSDDGGMDYRGSSRNGDGAGAGAGAGTGVRSESSSSSTSTTGCIKTASDAASGGARVKQGGKVDGLIHLLPQAGQTPAAQAARAPAPA